MRLNRKRLFFCNNLKKEVTYAHTPKCNNHTELKDFVDFNIIEFLILPGLQTKIHQRT
jgi:hypothetical protein